MLDGLRFVQIGLRSLGKGDRDNLFWRMKLQTGVCWREMGAYNLLNEIARGGYEIITREILN